MKAMKNKHTQMFLICNVIYIIFVLRGLSTNHYQNLGLDYVITDSLEILVWLIPACIMVLKLVSRQDNYFKDSLWLAFYITVPFAVYDSIFLGIIKGFGFNFLSHWWFLTVFYIILWIEFPIVGYLMQAADRKMEKKHFLMIAVSIICWLLNYWMGIYSNHYQAWTLDMKIIRLTNIPLILFPITCFLLRHYSDMNNYIKDSCFLALYLSFAFILFDFYYLAAAKNHGAGYLHDYWFVTLFYPLFWLVVPTTGWIMKRTTLRTIALSHVDSCSS